MLKVITTISITVLFFAFSHLCCAQIISGSDVSGNSSDACAIIGDIYLKTPKGTIFQGSVCAEMEPEEILQITNRDLSAENCETIVLVDSASCMYNCHSYAWNMTEGGPKCWIKAQDVINSYIGDGSFVETTIEDAEKVLYFVTVGSKVGNHSAVKSTTHYGLFESKFTEGPLLRHELRDCYFKEYEVIRFYRMSCRKEYKNKTISVNLNIMGCDTLTIENVNITDSTVTITANEEVIFKSGFYAAEGTDVSISIVNPIQTAPPNNVTTISGETEYQSLNNSEKKNIYEFTLSPNPNSGTFKINTNFPLTEVAHLKNTNALGVSVFETNNLISNEIQMHTSAKGVHLVLLALIDKTVLTQKIIIH